MFKSLCFATFLLLSTIAHAADVYQWRDSQGEVHFSDTPPPTDQEGVELLKVNGKNVNVFHSVAAQSAVATKTTDQQSQPARVPRDEADCAEIHGRPCDWDNQWRQYAEANCARVGDDHCGDENHLRAHHDPRVHARQQAARGGHR